MTDGGTRGETEAQKLVIQNLSVSSSAILKAVEAQAAEIQKQIDAMSDPAEMSPSDFLELQFQINLFRQLNETATNVLSTFNDAINAAHRNIK